MTEILTVDRVEAGPDRAVLASLPRHFRRGGREIHLASSKSAGWSDRLADAIRGGARGALVTGAGTAEPGALAALAKLARSSGVPVVVDVRFGYDPIWAVALPEIGRSQAAILDSLVHDTEMSPLELLVTQLAMVRSLLPDMTALRVAHRTASSYAVCGEVAGTVVNLAGAASLPGAPALRIEAAALDRRWEAVFDDDAVATPALVTRRDDNGSVTLPVAYEGSRRCAWRTLHRAVVERAVVPYGLEELLADRTLATNLVGGS